VVAKEAVPVERVRLTKDTEQHDEQVSEEVRKERIEAEGDVEGTTGRTTR
jgi:stress response protein YsnF